MDVRTIAPVLACLACVSHGRRMQPSTGLLHGSRPPEFAETARGSSQRVSAEGAVHMFSALTLPLLAAHSVAAWHHPSGVLGHNARDRLGSRVAGVSMKEQQDGAIASVQKQFAIDVSDVINPERPPIDYVRLPAEAYNVLDNSAVKRLEGGRFEVSPGSQKIMLIGEVEPTATIRLQVGEQGVQQIIEGIYMKGKAGKKPGMVLDQINKTMRALEVTNSVAALPTGEITCRLGINGHFKEGLMAKVPGATLSKLFTTTVAAMMPWFLQQLRNDYSSWARGEKNRMKKIGAGEMQKAMKQVIANGTVELPPGMREIDVQGQSAEDLIGPSLNLDSSPASGKSSKDPLLLRAARGEAVERTPVWMMRQAGRHMAAYRALIDKYPTFRERSEIPEVSREISLQPWEAYGTDGVILFSDILTPLPAMGVDFSITEAQSIAIEPIRTREAFKRMTEHGAFNPERDIPFVGSVLGQLREAVATSEATVLGFVGLPFTLGTYLIEGATGKKTGFAEVAALRASDPELCHDILSLLAKNIAQYAIYQIDSGAQVIQVFDSWAGHLEPAEFDAWAAPYQKQVVGAIKEQRPDVPVIIYMAPDTHSENGQFLPRLAASGADVVSIDHTVDLAEAKQILADAGYPKIGLQGNLDPAILRDGPPEKILAETERILKAVGNTGHIMNLGHGIESTTPEQYAELFVNAVHDFKHSEASELVAA